ncbi:MAG: beta-ketoacyl synthase chain length factor [Syntrophales bacterium]|nr:beta-ketoacyl synthase chain length factor [Syntrophales bacterium]
MTNQTNDFHISGMGVISPQKTYDNLEFLRDIREYHDNVLTCVVPDLREYVNPAQLRRLSRMLRMGLAAAVICLRDAGLDTIDAVIAATGYGLQEEMGKFLSEMLEQDEQYLTPTYFMQSTYNALAGLISLSFRCTGYNNTHVGRGFAFETALQDAMIHLQENPGRNVLVGAFDEVSAVKYIEQVRTGHLKGEKIKSRHLFESETTGTIQGEGTAMFLLSSSPRANSICRLQGVGTVYRPAGHEELARAVDDFLSANGFAPADIDVVVGGMSGDVIRDRVSIDLCRNHFRHAAQVRFKHLTGEYATASAFALWLGAMILKQGRIPPAVLVGPQRKGEAVRTILVCNHYMAKYYSFLLLTAP